MHTSTHTGSVIFTVILVSPDIGVLVVSAERGTMTSESVIREGEVRHYPQGNKNNIDGARKFAQSRQSRINEKYKDIR